MKWFFPVLAVAAVSRLIAAEPVSFSKDVAPIFVAKCLACHNADKAKGSYRLHTFEALMKPGSSKDAPVAAGKPAQSKIVQLITATNEDDRMPQKDEPLPAAQIEIIRQWMAEGATFDGPDRAVPLAILAPPRHAPAPTSYARPVPITALAFRPAGDVLVASGYHEITCWDAGTGTLKQRIGNVAERTFDLAFSPDGRWLAAASGTPGKIGEVKLFQGSNGEFSRLLATTADAVLCVAFSPDGKTLAAGGADNVIRLWDLAADKPPIVIEQNADWVLTVAFSPAGDLLAAGGRDKSARVFKVETGELDETYTGHGDFVTAVAWPDEKSVISACRTKAAHRWNIKDTKKSGEFSGWSADPTRLVVDGTNLFSASLDGQVRQHNLETKELVRTFEPHHDAVYSLAWQGATQRLAAGGHDGEVRVWSLSDGALRLKFLAAPGYTPKLSRFE